MPDVDWWYGTRGNLSERRFAMTQHAFGVRGIEREADEELCRHTATLASVIAAAGRTGTGGRGLPKFGEQLRMAPDFRKPTGRLDRARLELIVQYERTGVHVPDRVDQAHDAACST